MARVSVLCIYLLAIAHGASHVFSYEDHFILVIYSLGVVVFASVWAYHDSKQRNVSFAFAFRILYLITCPLSTIVYLIWTRGLTGIAWSIANFVGVSILFNLGFYAAYYILYFSGFWSLYDPIFLE